MEDYSNIKKVPVAQAPEDLLNARRGLQALGFTEIHEIKDPGDKLALNYMLHELGQIAKHANEERDE